MRLKSISGYIVVALILLTMASPISAATTFVDATLDYPNIIVVGITDTQYAMAGQHTAYANVTVTSPTGRRVYQTGFHANIVTTTVYVPINEEYGDWNATNDGLEWCPVANVYYIAPLAITTWFVNASQTTYDLVLASVSTCDYVKAVNCPSYSCGALTYTILHLPTETCAAHLLNNHVYLYVSGIRYCFPVGHYVKSPFPGACN